MSGRFLVVLLGALALAACSTPGSVKPGQEQAAVRATAGRPTAVVQLPDGGTRWQYSGQPFDQSVWNIDFDSKGRVVIVEQMMSDAAFARIRSGRDTRAEVLRDFGPFVARRPDFPIKIGLYSFSSDVDVLQPIQPYNRDQVRRALAALRRPGGGTAIGDAMREARPDLYRAVFRKYILVLTDGENTHGREPDEVARDIWRKSERAVQIYFVAFDTSPAKFAFLKEVGGDVIGAGSGAEHVPADLLQEPELLRVRVEGDEVDLNGPFTPPEDIARDLVRVIQPIPRRS